MGRAVSSLARWVVAAWAIGAAAPASAAGLDVRAWLDRPGVKLLAVEFYATWCRPCMEAVPKWKALHERYKNDGLRLVVVATQDPEAGCSNPGWNPDEVICDDDGRLAQAMGAGDRLPAAFLWSWQGNLLVRGGHVEDVEAAIRSWVRDAPRVDVRVPSVAKGSGVDERALAELVRVELARSGKLTVLATEAERARLDELRRTAMSARFEDDSRCTLGKELSPNSLLEASVLGVGSKQRLRLALLSVERGCLMASALVDWNRDNPMLSAAEGAAKLFQKLRPEVQMPRGGAVSFSARPVAPMDSSFGERDEPWDPAEAVERVIVSFASMPPGAVVLLDGELLCQDTAQGCSRAVPKGRHTVTMQRERYQKRSEALVVEKEMKLEWRLSPSFGSWTVKSNPPDLELRVDGRTVGKTPVQDLALDPGKRELLVTDPCYYDQGRRVTVKAGEVRDLSFEMKPRLGAIDVVAVDRAGNAKKGEAFVDGRRLGGVPGVYKLPICAKNLEIVMDGRVAHREALKVKEKLLAHVKAIIDSEVEAPRRASAVPAATASPSIPPGPRPAIGVVDDGRFTLMGRTDPDHPEVHFVLGRMGYRLETMPVAAIGRVTWRNRGRLSALVVPPLDVDSRQLVRAIRGSRKGLRAFVNDGGTVALLLTAGRTDGYRLARDALGQSGPDPVAASGATARVDRSVERSLGLSGLPESLPLPSSAVGLSGASLGSDGHGLYLDAAGAAVVAVIPAESGRLMVLGWDGEAAGGWPNVLDTLLR